jgi:hypothetical protein
MDIGDLAKMDAQAHKDLHVATSTLVTAMRTRQVPNDFPQIFQTRCQYPLTSGLIA